MGRQERFVLLRAVQAEAWPLVRSCLVLHTRTRDLPPLEGVFTRTIRSVRLVPRVRNKGSGQGCRRTADQASPVFDSEERQTPYVVCDTHAIRQAHAVQARARSSNCLAICRRITGFTAGAFRIVGNCTNHVEPLAASVACRSTQGPAQNATRMPTVQNLPFNLGRQCRMEEAWPIGNRRNSIEQCSSSKSARTQ